MLRDIIIIKLCYNQYTYLFRMRYISTRERVLAELLNEKEYIV